MKFITCTKEYHKKAQELVCMVFSPTMIDKYPFLLSESNMDHMFIAVEDEQVVGVITYFVNDLLLGLVKLKLASIGAVSTHPDFRGRGIASTLLLCAEKKMIEEEIDVIVISGDLHIYKQFGADHLSLLAQFDLPKVQSDTTITSYLDKDLDAYYEFYLQHPFRFERTKEEFKRLSKAVITPDPWESSYFHGIYLNDKLTGYCVLNVRGNATTGMIREFAGDPKSLLDVSGKLMDAHHLKQLHLELVHNDPLVRSFSELGVAHHHQAFESTIKIVDFNRFIDRLQDYFEYVLGDDHDALFIRYYDQKYHFKYKDQEYSPSDFKEASHILFGPYENEDLLQTELGDLLQQLFPLPFVYTSNMNYQ
ncbi:MAG: GNAT family N-acetyltransferase [Erysipelotrichaceae bacterium]|nr:GNAT family N-acetyltransferase [Erysipelotrichaceae bacterium]